MMTGNPGRLYGLEGFTEGCWEGEGVYPTEERNAVSLQCSVGTADQASSACRGGGLEMQKRIVDPVGFASHTDPHTDS